MSHFNNCSSSWCSYVPMFQVDSNSSFKCHTRFLHLDVWICSCLWSYPIIKGPLQDPGRGKKFHHLWHHLWQHLWHNGITRDTHTSNSIYPVYQISLNKNSVGGRWWVMKTHIPIIFPHSPKYRYIYILHMKFIYPVSHTSYPQRIAKSVGGRWWVMKTETARPVSRAEGLRLSEEVPSSCCF